MEWLEQLRLIWSRLPGPQRVFMVSVAVALLGQLHPLGVTLAALLLAGVRLGATNGLQLQAHIPRELGGAMIAMMILFVSAEPLYAAVLSRLRRWVAPLLPKRGDAIPSEEK